MTGKLAAVCLSLAMPAGSLADRALPAGAGRFMRQLEEPSWILRADALEQLARHRVEQAIAPIRELASDAAAGPWLRGRALIALCRLEGADHPPELLRQFADAPAAELRAAAAEALEQYPASAASRPLITRLVADPDTTVRFTAAGALASQDGEAAWPVVDALTGTPPPPALPLACRALALVATDEAINRLSTHLLGAEDPLEVIRALSDVREPKLAPVLLDALARQPIESPVFPSIIASLARLDRAAVVTALGRALARKDEATTFAAARALTLLIQEPSLGEPLREAIAAADDIETIKAGLMALGSHAMNPDSHREFFTAYLGHADPDLRTLAIRCLAHCESANLYEVLAALIDDEVPSVSYAALGALMRAPLDQAPAGRLVAYLEPTLVSDDEATRKLGFDLLGHAGGREDFQPALAMLGDALRGKDTKRREAVAAALGSIAPEDGIAPVARSQGYVSYWRVVGTFLNDKEHSGFAREFPPEQAAMEEEIDFEATFPSTYVWALNGHHLPNEKPIEREVGWTEAPVDRTDGKLRLGPLLPPPGTFSVAYAVSEFTLPEEREVIIDIDGDDAFRVWLNGTEIANQVAPHQNNQPCVATSLGHKVTLAAGRNRVVAKSANIGFEWWLRMRLTDAEGLPVEVGGP